MTDTRRTGLRRLWYIASWRARYWWLDTRGGMAARAVLALAVLVATVGWIWRDVAHTPPAGQPLQAIADWVVYAIMFVVSIFISLALAPKPKNAEAQRVQVAQVEEGATLKRIYGPVWIDDPHVIGDQPNGTVPIRKKAGKTWQLKTKWQTVGHWYKRIFHFLLCVGPIDKVLAIRIGDKEAWAGELTASGAITVTKPNLWGGEDSEGGVDGEFEFMFGEADQAPNAYLAANLSPKQSAYRGRTSVVFKGGRWGNSPYFKSPSFFVSRIYNGWDDECWYPEKAAVPIFTDLDSAPWVDSQIDPRNPENQHQYRFSTVNPWRANLAEAIADSGRDPDDAAILLGWSLDKVHISHLWYPLLDGVETLYLHFNRFSPTHQTPWRGAMPEMGITGIVCGPMQAAEIEVDSGRYWWNYDMGHGPNAALVGLYQLVNYQDRADGKYPHEVGINNCTNYPEVAGHFPVVLASYDVIIEVRRVRRSIDGINPAHVLYDSVTARAMDGEPPALVNDASFRAAADRLYEEGFGIGTVFDASKETIEQFQQRICDLIAGRLSRDPTTGLWHLDLIRDDIDVDDLPVLTDDDVLELERQPSTLDEAVNQVVVEWFDPLKKENRSTAPVQALGAIHAFGSVNGEVRSYREVLHEELALSLANRDLLAKSSAVERMSATTTRVPYAWRPGKKFRLIAPKHGIAEMVCILGGDLDRGSLRSGAMRINFGQVVATMADTTYVQPEPGDAPPTTFPALPAPSQAAFETPYRELVEILAPADLAALGSDAAYVSVVAARPPGAVDYDLRTRAGAGGFTPAAVGEWCPTAQVVEACSVSDPDGGLLRTTFTLEAGSDLDSVEVGSAGLWGSEIVRVDALDLSTLDVEFGRGCADTVPQPHPAGERVWFFDAFSTVDPEERSSGVTVEAKVLTRTGSAQLAEPSAPTSAVELASRQARPYPPSRLRINGEAYPASAVAELTIAWAHRDRLAQGDELVDEAAGDIGPEPGTTYRVRCYLDDVLDDEQTGITGTSATFQGSGNGALRIEVESVRDGLVSWQALAHELIYWATPYAPYEDQDGNTYADQDGTIYEG